ncbi:MAG: hypothetical protein GY805_02475 [Chloroflexi bacterium]|nr:hypothetical protein [Chloroflexota bacterium]
MVRDAFYISGKIIMNPDGHIVQVSLNQAHDLAASFIDAFASFLARDGTVANLRQIWVIKFPELTILNTAN